METTWKTRRGVEMTDQEWRDAWNKGGGEHDFSWRKWYGERDSYPELHALLEMHRATLCNTFTRAEGKCIKCTARMSIRDVGVLIPNDHGGEHTVTLIEDYRDHWC